MNYQFNAILVRRLGEQACNIRLMRYEIQARINSCGKQKNVNMTIKDGLMIISEIAVVTETDLNLVIKKLAACHESLSTTEEATRKGGKSARV